MKKPLIFISMAIILVLAFVVLSSAQPMGPGMMGPGYDYRQQGEWNYCPYCGSYMGPQRGYGMRPDMMGRGYGMGPGMMGGMMGRGYGMGQDMMDRGRSMSPQYGPQYGRDYQGPQDRQSLEPMKAEDAKKLLENYLGSTGNPNLELGKMEDKGEFFEAEIQTKDGSLADKIRVDKRTGWMHSIY